ncbi:hypothetical protein JTB14_015391 [Gonioctena quinquepunctata]|nr:hypothetical protein JTB14_015391 [Gonioctena quinquepunctata]
MSPYLNRGHHLIMDNFYNSVSSSDVLLKKHATHTTGSLRANRKKNPKIVTSYKIKKGEHIWRRRGAVYVSKWKDRSDVLMITTKYHPKLIQITNRHGQIQTKPLEVCEYNKYMAGVDRSDQLTSCCSSPRKTIR